MKIVFVDSSVSGHHIPYITALADLPDDALAVLSGEIEHLNIPQKKCLFPDGPKRKAIDFLKWAKAVKKIVDKEAPDIVHFLMGDDFYRFFGAGLGMFSKYKVVVTLHWLRSGVAGKISTKCIAEASDRVVAHSAYIEKKLNSYGIRNLEHIEYPQFGTVFYAMKEARNYWKLNQEIPVISFIGNTRYDKGLDILLEALKKVRKPFQLLIAGKATYFSEAYITDQIQPYNECVRFHLAYLSDEELASAVSAADIVILPYRKKFDGASGPLGDGVVHSKMIVGPNHGNLGDTIRKNHLGYTFETENTDSLAEVLDRALGESWHPDEQYRKYRDMLSPERFRMKYMDLYTELLQD